MEVQCGTLVCIKTPNQPVPPPGRPKTAWGQVPPGCVCAPWPEMDPNIGLAIDFGSDVGVGICVNVSAPQNPSDQVWWRISHGVEAGKIVMCYRYQVPGMPTSVHHSYSRRCCHCLVIQIRHPQQVKYGQCPCKNAYYCSEWCQQKDWSRHKHHCPARTDKETILQLMPLGKDLLRAYKAGQATL